jgi:hypothetical protein
MAVDWTILDKRASLTLSRHQYEQWLKEHAVEFAAWENEKKTWPLVAPTDHPPT